MLSRILSSGKVEIIPDDEACAETSQLDRRRISNLLLAVLRPSNVGSPFSVVLAATYRLASQALFMRTLCFLPPKR